MKQAINNEFAQRFQRFSEEFHAKGSGTATSYVTALNKLNAALRGAGCFLQPGESVWDIHDDGRLAQLYTLVKNEQKKPDGGIFRNESAKSYWKQGFCSAAVKDFARFLSLSVRQEQMLNAFDSATDGSVLARNLESMRLSASPMLLDNDDIVLTSAEGKTCCKD